MLIIVSEIKLSSLSEEFDRENVMGFFLLLYFLCVLNSLFCTYIEEEKNRVKLFLIFLIYGVQWLSVCSKYIILQHVFSTKQIDRNKIDICFVCKLLDNIRVHIPPESYLLKESQLKYS